MGLDPSTLDPIVISALREDIGEGDLTTKAVLDRQGVARARIVSRQVDGFGVTTACLGQKQDEREVVRCSALGDFEKSFSLIRIQCLALFYRAEA